MYNSGIIYVDAAGLDVAGGEQTVAGLYQKLTDALNSGKMVVLCGMTNNDAQVSPAPVICTMGAGATITMSGFSAVVTEDDSVTPVAGA